MLSRGAISPGKENLEAKRTEKLSINCPKYYRIAILDEDTISGKDRISVRLALGDFVAGELLVFFAAWFKRDRFGCFAHLRCFVQTSENIAFRLLVQLAVRKRFGSCFAHSGIEGGPPNTPAPIFKSDQAKGSVSALGP